MALKDLLQHAGEITGTGVIDTARRDSLVRMINRASREIYDSGDLPNSLYESVFTVNGDSQMITVPWYAADIRAIRRATYSNVVQLVTMHPRYHYRPWRQPTLQWRIKGHTALSNTLTQTGQLRITIAQAQESAFTVTVRGQTATASLIEETVTFQAGDLTHDTANQWVQASPMGVQTIRKSAKTTCDVVITQTVDGAEVARIPNFLLESRNTLIQVHDGAYTLVYTQNEGAEILYKWPFIELTEDNDQFLRGDIFDQVIIWKMREHWHSVRAGENEPGIALAAKMKCEELLRNICNNQESATEKMVKYEENPYELAVLGANRFQRYAAIQ